MRLRARTAPTARNRAASDPGTVAASSRSGRSVGQGGSGSAGSCANRSPACSSPAPARATPHQRAVDARRVGVRRRRPRALARKRRRRTRRRPSMRQPLAQRRLQPVKFGQQIARHAPHSRAAAPRRSAAATPHARKTCVSRTRKSSSMLVEQIFRRVPPPAQTVAHFTGPGGCSLRGAEHRRHADAGERLVRRAALRLPADCCPVCVADRLRRRGGVSSAHRPHCSSTVGADARRWNRHSHARRSGGPARPSSRPHTRWSRNSGRANGRTRSTAAGHAASSRRAAHRRATSSIVALAEPLSITP